MNPYHRETSNNCVHWDKQVDELPKTNDLHSQSNILSAARAMPSTPVPAPSSSTHGALFAECGNDGNT